MAKTHHYQTSLNWTGNTGQGTKSYTSYERSHIIAVENKPEIPASSDPSFRGDKTRYNPEELLVASLSSCHMLWYLHLCSEAGIIVESYSDTAKGEMTEEANGSGRFTEVILYPEVVISDAAKLELANELHEKAHQYCFIANSCNFPVKTVPNCILNNSLAKPI
ncbi:OsmC family protein [Danxiaibacter flavus]|uniref:OsmC family protein n=1 Tax=Danxiaibacter flavus TaxID=3049108 RepID=A0ABV3Z873_9BACT|nr:OsmC family protein [Chitinophagaceae bacterium DXS]